MKIFDYIFLNFYSRILNNVFWQLKKELNGCKTILDLGCGWNSPIRFFSKKFYSVGVDKFKWCIEESKKKKIYNEYYLMNVLDVDKKFKPKSFDCVLALDLIEHLNKKEGLKLLKKMEKIAIKKIIVQTPNGSLKRDERFGNILMVHKSGWTSKEMKKMGYKVIGMRGFKIFDNKIPFATLTERFVKNKPEIAFNIFCVKEL